jgi:Zn-dependent protease with chaperone function
MIQPLFAVALALAPGALAWWSGRRVVALRDDPLLPERLLERTRRLTQVSVVVAVLLMFALPAQAPWALPLAVLALVLGVFPARRVLRDETWGVGRYLLAVGRFQLGAIGIWVLIAAAPLLVLAAGPARWPVAAGLGVLLLVWGYFYGWLFLRLVGATPLNRADLDPRFAAIGGRASLKAPLRAYRFGFTGGRMANAFALPAQREASVLFSDQVLGFLEPDEVAAIFAHEVGHLEHWDRRRLRQSRLAMVAVVALAVVGVPLLQLWLASWTPMIAWGWVLALLVALGVRTTHQKRHESDSDRRAAALCEDPEALARGLTKLTTLARLPRRWADDVERSASHPSLARRIQAIRAAAGTAPGRLAAPIVIRTERPGQVVLLEAERVSWLEGIPEGTPPEPAAVREGAASLRAVRYGALVELRVRPGILNRGPALVARARSGRSWSVPIGAADVVAAQAALDVVDAQLGQEARPRGLTLVVARALAACVVSLAVLGTAFVTTAIAGVVALLLPGRAALAALGTAVLGSGLLGLWSPESFVGVTTVWASIALTALGVPALWLARAAGPEPRVRERRTALAAAFVLSTLGFAAAASAFLGGVEPADLAALPWTAPNACVGLAAAAAALLTILRPAFSRVAIALAVLALTPVTLALGGRVAGPRSGLSWREGSANLVNRADVGTVAGTLRIAPSGTRFAVTLVTPGRQGLPPAFQVGDFTGAQRPLAALDVAFLDDRRLLALLQEEAGLAVQLVAATGTTPPWRVSLADLEAPRLTALGSDRWQIVGTEPVSEATVVASGRVGSDAVIVKRWAPDSDADTERAFLAGDAVYRVTVRPAPWTMSRWATVWMLLGPRSEVAHTSLARLGSDGWRTLGTWRRPVRCEAVADGRVVCLAPLSGGTHVFVLEPGGAHLMTLGEIPGPVWRWSAGPTGEVGMITSDGRGALLDITTRRVTQFALGADAGGPVEALPLPGRLAVLARSRNGSTVSVYEVVRGGPGKSGAELTPSELSAVSQVR